MKGRGRVFKFLKSNSRNCKMCFRCAALCEGENLPSELHYQAARDELLPLEQQHGHGLLRDVPHLQKLRENGRRFLWGPILSGPQHIVQSDHP